MPWYMNSLVQVGEKGIELLWPPGKKHVKKEHISINCVWVNLFLSRQDCTHIKHVADL
jgi:hypothetical protein